MHPSNLFFILAALAASSMAQDVIPSTIADSIPTHETNAIDTVSVGGGSTGVGPVSLPSGIQTDSDTLPTISGSVAPSEAVSGVSNNAPTVTIASAPTSLQGSATETPVNSISSGGNEAISSISTGMVSSKSQNPSVTSANMPNTSAISTSEGSYMKFEAITIITAMIVSVITVQHL